MSDEKKEQWGEVGKWKMKRKQLASLPGKDCRRNFLENLGFPSENGIQMGPRRKDIFIAPIRNFWTTNLERKWVLGRERVCNEMKRYHDGWWYSLITINGTACRLRPRDNDYIISNFILTNTPWKIKTSDGQGGDLVLKNCLLSIL